MGQGGQQQVIFINPSQLPALAAGGAIQQPLLLNNVREMQLEPKYKSKKKQAGKCGVGGYL